MSPSRHWLALPALVVLVLTGAAPPGRPTAEQQHLLARRDRLDALAADCFGRNKMQEHWKHYEPARDIDIQVYTLRHLRVLDRLRHQVMLDEWTRDWPEAHRLRALLVELTRQLYGASDWRVAEARRGCEYTRRLEKLSMWSWVKVIEADLRHRNARLLREQGKLDEALEKARGALERRQQVFGPEDRLVAESLNELAAVHQARGEPRQAIPLVQEAIRLYRKTVGEDHPDLAIALNNLGVLHFDLANYRLALELFLQAQAILARTRETWHADHAAVWSNLGLVRSSIGDHADALVCFQRACSGILLSASEKHPGYLASLNNLAAEYKELGEYDKALALQQEVLALSRRLYFFEHPRHADALHNLATIQHDSGKLEKALAGYEEALRLRQKLLSPRHPNIGLTLANLAILHQAMGQPAKARERAEQSLAITRWALDLGQHVQSERAQLAALSDLYPRFEFLLSLPEAESTYTHVLAWKGAVFRQQWQGRLRSRLLASGNSHIRSCLADVQKTSRELAHQFGTLQRDSQDTDEGTKARELTGKLEALEARLVQLSADYQSQQERGRLTPAGLQAVLPADTVLIDFVAYTRQEHHRTAREVKLRPWLTAFITGHDAPTRRLDLGEAEPIVRAIDRWRQAAHAGRDPGLPGIELRRLVWEPLLPYLGKAKTVLISPDGSLARLPFAALPGAKQGTYLVEQYAIGIIPVPQLLPELLAPAKPGPERGGLLLVGDVDFDRGAASEAGPASPARTSVTWARLPATSDEIQSVATAFQARFARSAVTALRGPAADRATVRSALARHRYVHLATHGYFAGGESQALRRGVDSRGVPMRSHPVGWHPGVMTGLVFSGANRSGRDDGVLTALEVASTDLTGCDLAVLSACETALGTPSEVGQGLLGLQRAFQVAGARSVVASLWKVDDRATQSLMSRFYDNLWRRGMSRLDALTEAQRWLLREGVKHPGLVRGPKNPLTGTGERLTPDKADKLPPFWWAAFVLSGDWR